MGGSGDGGPRPSTGGSSGKKDDCDLSIRTNLFGSVPTVAETMKVGDMTDIVLLVEGAIASVAVLTRDEPPLRAGTIAGVPEQDQLVSCLQNGVTYEAKITQAEGSKVRLSIRRS